MSHDRSTVGVGSVYSETCGVVPTLGADCRTLARTPRYCYSPKGERGCRGPGAMYVSLSRWELFGCSLENELYVLGGT